MPAFGFLLIILGIFVIVNTFNGNLYKLTQGEIGFNFISSSSNTANTPTIPNLPNLTANKPSG